MSYQWGIEWWHWVMVAGVYFVLSYYSRTKAGLFTYILSAVFALGIGVGLLLPI